MFGCSECSLLYRSKHQLFCISSFCADGRASSDTWWICGLTAILKDLNSKGQMTPYIPIHAQIACAVWTEQKIQDHHRLHDLLLDRFWWFFLLRVFMWTHPAADSNFCISWFIHFFPFPHGGRAYTSILGASRIQWSSHSSDYFPGFEMGQLQLFVHDARWHRLHILSPQELPRVLTEHCYHTYCCSCCI